MHFSIFLFSSSQLLQQRDQLEQRVGIQSSRWQAQSRIGTRIGPVGPIACDAKAAALAFTENERVNAC